MTPELPPRQISTTRWPVIGERDPEPFDAAEWRLEITGVLEKPLSLTWDEFRAMPRVEERGTIHCVTRWSRPHTGFRGVRLSTLLGGRAGPGAKFVRFASGRGHDTTLPLATACDAVLVADEVSLDGVTWVPIDPEHGGPVRTITFAQYFYKSVKWIRALELLAEDRLGFWERSAGYHNGADPHREERYIVREADGATLRKLLNEKNLAGRDLLSSDLRGLDLEGMDFSGASLRNANLRGAKLRDANLARANLTNADLHDADLRGARLDGVDLDGADLRKADLRGATGVPKSMAVAQFFSKEDDGALVDGVDWSGARAEGLLPEQEEWLRARGVLRAP